MIEEDYKEEVVKDNTKLDLTNLRYKRARYSDLETYDLSCPAQESSRHRVG